LQHNSTRGNVSLSLINGYVKMKKELKDEFLTMRLPASVKAKLVKESAKEHRTLQSQVIFILRKFLK